MHDGAGSTCSFCDDWEVPNCHADAEQLKSRGGAVFSGVLGKFRALCFGASGQSNIVSVQVLHCAMRLYARVGTCNTTSGDDATQMRSHLHATTCSCRRISDGK